MIPNIRNILFWSMDKLTGSKKKSNYEDIKFLLESKNNEEVHLRKKEYVNSILLHAINTVPYYQNSKPVLEDFPLVDKNIIRNNYENFQSSTYLNQKNRKVSTSGSTGTPFSIDQNRDKTIRNTADNLFFWKKANYAIGDKLYSFRLWNAFEKKKSFIYFTQNIIPIDVFDLTPTFMNQLVHNLQKTQKKCCVLGYVSAFEKICKYLDKTNPDYKTTSVKSAIAISEKLNQYTKESVQKYFGIQPISRYSNIENGIIAQQPIGKDHFIINEASYHLEIFNLEKDEPEKNGILGRMVITDLFNYCTPMIRYDTGDLGKIEEINGKRVLTQITGRKIDAIKNTSGEIILFNIVLIINKYVSLIQCQLIQKDKKQYVLKLNATKNFTKEKELIDEFKTYLGKDANIRVVYVSEIPVLASGKRRVMVNEMIE